MADTVILGGGQTGRGFIGRLLCESGIPFIIVDQNRELIEALKQKGEYRVNFFSTRPPVTVSGFEAYHADSPQASEAIQNAANIFISVGAENLKNAARYLLENKAKPRNIILCENAIQSSAIVRDVLSGRLDYFAVNIVETAIFCTTINVKGDPVDILSEELHKLNFDSKSAKSCFFKAPFFEPETDFEILLKRKIYTHQAASAIIAYNGWRLGYSVYSDAANDPAILKLLRDFYFAIDNAICSEYGIAPNVQREFAKLSLKKFMNPSIVDSIERNARQPRRKLGPDERIAYPMKLLLKYNFNIQPLCKTAASAVLYGERVEEDWIKLYGVGYAGLVFSHISGIKDQTVIDQVDFAYKNANLISCFTF